MMPSVSEADRTIYREKVIPYWKNRTMRERAFAEIPDEWKALYEAGLFTEFMEQRAPGHTSLDGAIYRRGMRDFRVDIAAARARLDWSADSEVLAKDEELKAMDIACEAAIIFAERHAYLADSLASAEPDPGRAGDPRRLGTVGPDPAPASDGPPVQHAPCHPAGDPGTQGLVRPF